MKEVIFILGMHRSGTSALTGVLKILGADLGFENQISKFDNPKGHFENPNVYPVNDAILKNFGSGWNRLQTLPQDWWKHPGLSDLKKNLKEFILQSFTKSDVIAVKDPRMCIVFPFWRDIFSELGMNIKCILPVRSPEEVALSLQKRNNMNIKKALSLWNHYVVNAEYNSRNYPRIIVSFNSLLNNTEQSVSVIQANLDIKFPFSYEEKRAEINEFLEADLKHHNSGENNTYYEELPEVYEYYNDLLKLELQDLASINTEKFEYYRQKYLAPVMN